MSEWRIEDVSSVTFGETTVTGLRFYEDGRHDFDALKFVRRQADRTEQMTIPVANVQTALEACFLPPTPSEHPGEAPGASLEEGKP